MKIIKELLVFIALMCSTTLWAYDFEAMNDDGVTIYYNVLSDEDLTCEVTYLYYNSSSNNEAYSGEVSIPETATYNGTMYTVTAIGSCAFYNCSALTNVTIPNSVTTIWGSAFYKCSNLAEINLPNSLTTISGWAFAQCTELTEVTIPNSVTSIGSYAFYNCSGLKGDIFIPNSVATIGSYAFTMCTGLTEFNVAEDNANYCSVDGVLFTKNMTTLIQFPAASSMTSYTIPNSVTKIEIDAFYYCNGLTEVIIGNSVTSIGDYAFYQSTGLTSVTIPNSVTSIGEWAFTSCRGLMQIAIGNGVTEIGSYAFYKCTGMTQFEVAGDNEYYCAVDGVLFTKDMTTLIQFPTASSMTSYTIPNSVTLIGNYAFDECRGLTSVTIPESVTTIGTSAFDCCSGLTDVTIPNSVSEIGNSAFSGCTSLTELTIGNSVTEIRNYAFQFCYLESITTLNPEPPACGSNVFDYVPTSTCVLYVPEGTLEAYSTAYAWQDFLNIIDNQPNAIDDIMANGNGHGEVVGYYTLDGKKVSTPQRGINIIRYSDGSTKKVLLK